MDQPVYRSVGRGRPARGWVAVLNSRQARYPERGEEWIRATVKAVRDAADQGKGIVSSLGLHTWQLSLWAAGRCSAPAGIVLPSYLDQGEASLEHICDDFGIDRNLVTVFYFDVDSGPHRPKASWGERDTLIVSIADELWPVSIRPGGNLENLVSEGRRAGKQVVEDHRVAYRPSRTGIHRPIDTRSLAAWTRDARWTRLTHWTRSFDGPWPGERKAIYYRDLSQEGTGNPRSAAETLYRIVRERRLRGSPFRMPGKQPAVAFTELSPASAMDQIRYRKRFQRWSFEPYGLALDRARLEQLGARPVVYTSERGADGDLYIQGQRSGRADWSGQREWRVAGDVDLTCFDGSSGLVLVRSDCDCARFEQISPWPVLVLSEK